MTRHDLLRDLNDKLAAAEAENARLRADAERLDVLQRLAAFSDNDVDGRVAVALHFQGYGDDLREAIDWYLPRAPERT